MQGEDSNAPPSQWEFRSQRIHGPYDAFDEEAAELYRQLSPTRSYSQWVDYMHREGLDPYAPEYQAETKRLNQMDETVIESNEVNPGAEIPPAARCHRSPSRDHEDSCEAQSRHTRRRSLSVNDNHKPILESGVTWLYDRGSSSWIETVRDDEEEIDDHHKVVIRLACLLDEVRRQDMFVNITPTSERGRGKTGGGIGPAEGGVFK